MKGTIKTRDMRGEQYARGWAKWQGSVDFWIKASAAIIRGLGAKLLKFWCLTAICLTVIRSSRDFGGIRG